MRLTEGFWSFFDGFNLGRNTVWHLFNDKKDARKNNEECKTDVSQQKFDVTGSENDVNNKSE